MARLPVDVSELSNRNELPTGAMQTQQATAANTGGLVAGALGELGGAVSGLAMKIEENKRESKGFDIEQQFIRLQEEDARAYEEQKRGLAGSGDGFWEGSRDASNKRYDEFVSTLPKWAQDEYRTKAERKKAERSNSAFYDQYKQQDDNSRAVLGEEARKAGLGVQENPASFEEFRQQQYALIDKSTLPAAEKEAKKLEINNALAVTAAESDATNNPGAVMSSFPSEDGSTFDWVKHRSKGGSRPDAISGLDAGFRGSLEGLISSAPPGIKDGLSIFSGYRSVERQQELWDASDKSGKMVARPGHSQHNHGQAVDIEWNGVRLDKAPKEVQDWVAANLEKFGLTRPMDYEPWHVEPVGARGGKTAAVAAPSVNGREAKKDAATYREAIASIESRGTGDYAAIGPADPSLGRPLGRYQIMEANLPAWSKEALGREVTVEEFLKDGKIQDAIFDHKFGGYVAKYGEKGAAEAWFAGPGGVGKGGRKDSLGTSVSGYGDKFMAALGYSSTSQAPAYVGYLTPEQKSAYYRTAERELQGQLSAAQAAADTQRNVDQDAALLGIMEGPDPQGAYDAGRKEGLFSSPEEVKRADTALKEREKTDAETQRGLDIISGAVPADRTSAADRKAVNGAFNAALSAGADPEAAARGAFDRTGIVPPDFARGLIGGAQSRDPAQVQGSLASAASLLGKDPNAFNGVSNSGKLVDDAFEFTRRTTELGESAEDAAKAIMENRARPPLAAAAQEEALKGFRKDFLKPEAVEAGLAVAAENGWGADGRVPVGAETGGDAMRSIYKGLAEEGFRKFNDPDRAISYAATEMGRRFGVFNGTLTQYPPDKAGVPALPGADDPHAWVAEQAAAAATEQFGQEYKPGEVILVPIEERGVSTRGAFTGLPTPIPGKAGKASAPYSVVVIPEDGSPVMVVPGVFLPDIEAYVSDKNAAIPEAGPLPRGGIGVGVGYQGVTPDDGKLKTPEQLQAESDLALRNSQGTEIVRQSQEEENRKALTARQNRGRPAQE